MLRKWLPLAPARSREEFDEVRQAAALEALRNPRGSRSWRYFRAAVIAAPVPMIVFLTIMWSLGGHYFPQPVPIELAIPTFAAIVASWVAMAWFVDYTQAPWNYTKTILFLAICYTVGSVVIHYSIGDPKWDSQFGGLFIMPMLGGLLTMPLDIRAWLKLRREDARAAEIGLIPPP